MTKLAIVARELGDRTELRQELFGLDLSRPYYCGRKGCRMAEDQDVPLLANEAVAMENDYQPWLVEVRCSQCGLVGDLVQREEGPGR